MEYKTKPSEYLAGISPNRIKTVKEPKQAWKARARCFQLFDSGLIPSKISPRQCRVKRRTLYKYYQEWKIINAKMEMVIRQVSLELAREREAKNLFNRQHIRLSVRKAPVDQAST
jgi:hypothetical protein